jgi:hypothetical protein
MNYPDSSLVPEAKSPISISGGFEDYWRCSSLLNMSLFE